MSMSQICSQLKASQFGGIFMGGGEGKGQLDPWSTSWEVGIIQGSRMPRGRVWFHTFCSLQAYVFRRPEGRVLTWQELCTLCTVLGTHWAQNQCLLLWLLLWEEHRLCRVLHNAMATSPSSNILISKMGWEYRLHRIIMGINAITLWQCLVWGTGSRNVSCFSPSLILLGSTHPNTHLGRFMCKVQGAELRAN